MGTNDHNKTTPPAKLHDRKASIGPNKPNRLEVPCDPPDPDVSRWFDISIRPMRPGNRVTPLVGGLETFGEMGDAIGTATGKGHYIYMLNWGIDLGAPLRGSTLRQWIDKAAVNHVQVRAMLWDKPGRGNTPETDEINQRGYDCAAILDNNTLHFGSHHQKILIINGSGGLVAFCGGIDPTLNRISHFDDDPGSPLHDVHCKIEGPAAWDLLQIFVQRWTDHPDTPQLNVLPLLATASDPLPPRLGDHYVQIGRTYGNGSNHWGIKSKSSRYSFAPNGEQTCKSIIFHAIEQAREFIYLEDQYLQSPNASKALKAALPNIKKLIILTNHPSLISWVDAPDAWRYQREFVAGLGESPKIAVCYLKGLPAPSAPTPNPVLATHPIQDFAEPPTPAGATPSEIPGADYAHSRTLDIHDPGNVPDANYGAYVHSKTWIIDDKFAVIGSANCNTRGYTHDSEVVAGFYDESNHKPCTLHLAHALRIRLWAKHLVLDPNSVFDPIASAAHWQDPSATSGIAKFDPNARLDKLRRRIVEYVWKDQDRDGS